jgi:hypothetical protein
MTTLKRLSAVVGTLSVATSAIAGTNCEREVLDFFRLVGPDILRSGYIADFSAAAVTSEDADVFDAIFFAHPAYLDYVEDIDAGVEVEPAKFLATDGVIECLTAHPQLSVVPEEIVGRAADLDKEVSMARRAELRLMMQSK